MNALVLTPHIERSKLADGSVRYVASLEELPGVVCEGESIDAATSELIESVRSIRARAGLQAAGFNTRVSSQWVWEGYNGGDITFAFGSSIDPEKGVPRSHLPDNYRELQPLT